MIRCQTDPDACRNIHFVVVDDDRLCHGPEDFVRNMFGISNLLDIHQDDRKFVTAESTDGVDHTYGVFQSLANLFQQFIANRMAQRIIDNFEAVQIQIEDGAEMLHAFR